MRLFETNEGANTKSDEQASRYKFCKILITKSTKTIIGIDAAGIGDNL